MQTVTFLYYSIWYSVFNLIYTNMAILPRSVSVGVNQIEISNKYNSKGRKKLKKGESNCKITKLDESSGLVMD